VATRTHWARIATLLRWQNISQCALLISRPSFKLYTYFWPPVYFEIFLKEEVTFLSTKKNQEDYK